MAKLHRDQFGKLPYVLKKPTVTSGGMPTIIFLHGSGTRGTDLEALELNPFFGRNSCINNPKFQYMVFAPLCTRNSWFDVFEQLQEFVKMVASYPEVDHERISLVGTSMGGFAAWQLAMTMPTYFSSLVPICGGGMSWNVSRIIHIPTWAFHGADDTKVPVEAGIDMINKLKLRGGNARITVLERTGHNVWDYAYANEELFEWMRGQKKQPFVCEKSECNGSAFYG